jgi:hypothetical protein
MIPQGVDFTGHLPAPFNHTKVKFNSQKTPPRKCDSAGKTQLIPLTEMCCN